MLKAVLFDFNGVIINDEPIHKELIDEILLRENLRPSPDEFTQLCLGRSDRICLKNLLTRRGRIVTEDYLNKLIESKSQAYRQKLASFMELPIYSGVEETLKKIQSVGLTIGLVTGSVRANVELVLELIGIGDYFKVIIAGDDIKTSKPDPDGYLLAVKCLNQQEPAWQLKPENCLVIEDTPAGIQAAKSAGMQVVGIANTYPFHMLQRQANWTIDYLTELEIERIKKVFSGEEYELP